MLTAAILFTFISLTTCILEIDKDVYEGMIDRDMNSSFIKVPPRQLCKVFYRDIHETGAGNIFMPNLTLEKPTSIKWNASESSLYTLTLSYLLPINEKWPSFIEKQLWMITNIPGGNWQKGEVKLDYIPPRAPTIDEYYLSVLLIYKQPEKIDVKFDASLDNNATRYSVRIKEFSEQYKLGDPVAGTFYYVYLPLDYDIFVQEQIRNTRKPGKPYWT
ncbi:protein D3-like [Planococcus citri]|uniref:protein D3-like n=1 Tax=Planococcus citri TaxID=170843 RepID=UPI0031F7D05E